MSSPALQSFLAPALVGTWANSLAYMLELVLAWRYYTGRRHHTRPSNKGLAPWIVALQLVVDTMGTVFSWAAAYLVLIVHWGDVAYLANNPWPLPLYVISTGLSGYIEQLYLIRRYGALSKNYFICAVLALGATTSMGAAIGVGVVTFIHPSITDRKIVVPVTLLWFISSAVADAAIACALVFQLIKYQSPFKQTQHVVRRLIVSSVQTGSVTGLFTTLALVGFVAWPDTAITLAFGFFLGRVYGCTLLYNLVSVRRARDGGDTTDLSDERISGSRSRGREARERATALDTFGGIHVHQIVQVTKDTEISPTKDDGDDISTRDHKHPAMGREL
ncbi:hypothetical protein MIND_01338900 [Mycena indigotica]|uniref:DUF6534 domain-containing protein n=1 Tax=Mycena indigotica TaxID=2126181 RepID=A0A8H6VQE9_9AGAR|nr:uncharacterized protein MIND_01338900 [Mycena indigotica]KAF7290252.1 hypothetical protein MIND_01338900 [Mycena indigotica]